MKVNWKKTDRFTAPKEKDLDNVAYIINEGIKKGESKDMKFTTLFNYDERFLKVSAPEDALKEIFITELTQDEFLDFMLEMDPNKSEQIEIEF